jgi:hypothetical protein
VSERRCARIDSPSATKEVRSRRRGLPPTDTVWDAAPGSLGLVQDLLNTLAGGAPREADLLADLTTAQEWADGATHQWSALAGQPIPAIVLDAGGLDELRGFRDELHRLAALRASGEGAAEAGIPIPIVHGVAAALQRRRRHSAAGGARHQLAASCLAAARRHLRSPTG